MELQGSDQPIIGSGSPSVPAAADRWLLVHHHHCDAVHDRPLSVHIWQLRWMSAWPTASSPLVPVTRAANDRSRNRGCLRPGERSPTLSLGGSHAPNIRLMAGGVEETPTAPSMVVGLIRLNPGEVLVS